MNEGSPLVTKSLALRALLEGLTPADSGEPVGAVGDELGLGVADVVVHGGEVEQDVRDHTDEHAGAVSTLACVALGEGPEEHGREYLARSAYLAGELPEQAGALGAALGVELVDGVHLGLGDGAGPGPEPDGAALHEAV